VETIYTIRRAVGGCIVSTLDPVEECEGPEIVFTVLDVALDYLRSSLHGLPFYEEEGVEAPTPPAPEP
jgi:hypothetical protein